MKLWLSCECEVDILEKYVKAERLVENEINSYISGRNYSIALKSWDCIAIVRNDDVFKEIVKYSKTKKEMDFRLAIDYQAIAELSQKDCEKLIYEMLKRSLLLLKEKGLMESGIQKLSHDVDEVGKLQGWI